MWLLCIKIIMEIFIGIAAGCITASGLFAVINSIQIVNRIADVTHTVNCILYYEDVIISGAIAGNLLWILDIHIPLGITGVIIYGFFSGMYIGLFLVSLAEMVNSLPVFLRRIRIAKGLGIIVLAIGIGKAAGQLIYYFLLY